MISSQKRVLFAIGIGAAIVLAIGTAVFLLYARPVQVTVAPVRYNVPIEVFGLGTIEAQTLSKIGFETAGTLVELNADQGDSIKAGAVLAQLHAREQEARVAQAKAAISQARAGIAQAEAAIDKAETVLKQRADINVRRQQLVQRGVVSQEAADDSQASADIAKAELNQSRSALSVARTNEEQAAAVLMLEQARLAKYTLRAPFDGIVLTRHKELGSALNANEPVFTVVDPATIWALAYVDEARAGAIELGQPAIVTRRSVPGLRMNAKVVRIDIESDRINEERRIYLRCGGCPLAFHLGEQAEALVTVASLPQARLVKLGSLQNVKGQEAVAWTVEQGRLNQRTVSLGHRTLDGRVEIRDGLPEGAEIVDGPVVGLRVGRKATIVAAEDDPS